MKIDAYFLSFVGQKYYFFGKMATLLLFLFLGKISHHQFYYNDLSTMTEDDLRSVIEHIRFNSSFNVQGRLYSFNF